MEICTKKKQTEQKKTRKNTFVPSPPPSWLATKKLKFFSAELGVFSQKCEMEPSKVLKLHFDHFRQHVKKKWCLAHLVLRTKNPSAQLG